MKRLMATLMLSCKKASALIVKKEDFNLRRIEKIQLFFHTMMCSACSRFEVQNKMMSKALQHHAEEPKKDSNEKKAPEQLKDNILSKLEKGG